jgi:hypothetical protein
LKTGKLIINNTTLYPPDNDGKIEIYIHHGDLGYSGYVSLESLDNWVASIKEQIITVATDAVECNECLYHETRGDPYCAECGKRMRR